MRFRPLRRLATRGPVLAAPLSDVTQQADVNLPRPLDTLAAPASRVALLWSNPLGRAAIRAAQLLLVLALVGVAVFGLSQVSLAVLPLLIALILSSALWPLVRLARKVMSAMLAAWTVFLGALVVIGGVGTGIVFAVRAEWSGLVDQAVQGFQQLQGMVKDLPLQISQQQIDDGVKAVTDFLTSSQFGAGALTGLSAAGSFFTGLVLLLVILFFFLKDGDRIWAFFLSWIPRPHEAKWRASGTRTVETLGGYVRGTAVIAFVDAAGIGIALWILQVPLALPLAVIVFITSFIPMVGATFAGILATLVALVANGPVVALIVLGVVILVNQLEGNFLQPVVMAHALNLHALVILLALTIGTVLAGLVGAVLSVPLTAVAWAIVKIWTGRDTEAIPAQTKH
ncbi:Predicted PurR-regulated permease PerM [Arthrobacter alpinus]|uniref:Predicted PurR-regulated permease PerM n=1 Tax=Arthrobacter alpinus TaxID=656366 RepID=A0A1H5LL41_9MICC|nr:AI-2E family transporter [Arthrobacter alpinus]SEE77720.1 Predicted PurR-regulated permease PerM [Arthrobacter alpinus]